MPASPRLKALIWITLLSGAALLVLPQVEPQTNPAVALTPRLPTDETRPSMDVVATIQLDVLRRFGIEPVQVRSFSAQPWPDSCLDLAQPQETCTPGAVNGWRIEVSDGLQLWIYRTDLTGKLVRLENPERAYLPQNVARTLIQRVAKDTGIPVAKLKIVAAKPMNFQGCQLGIVHPRLACTKMYLPGWQVLVTAPQNTFVYRLSKTGNQIAKNDAASGAGANITVSFELFGGRFPSIRPDVIFQSTRTGSLDGRTTTLTLTADGKITELTMAPNIRSRPVVRKTLTPQQVAQFKQVLQTQKFTDLNHLSYLTAAAYADYPTTTYQTPESGVQFLDLEQKNLPKSLQRVIPAWNSLIRP
jgi:hypothetical protein